MDKQKIQEMIEKYVVEKENFLRSAEKQMAAYDGAIQALTMLLQEIEDDKNKPASAS